MSSDAGTEILQNDGSVTLAEDGGVLVSAGTSDCDCCDEEVYQQAQYCVDNTFADAWFRADDPPSGSFALGAVPGCLYLDPTSATSSTPGTIYPVTDAAFFANCAACAANTNPCVDGACQSLMVYSLNDANLTFGADGVTVAAGKNGEGGSTTYDCPGDAFNVLVQDGSGYWTWTASAETFVSQAAGLPVPPQSYHAVDDWTPVSANGMALIVLCDPTGSLPDLDLSTLPGTVTLRDGPSGPLGSGINGRMSPSSGSATADPRYPVFLGNLVVNTTTSNASQISYLADGAASDLLVNVVAVDGNYVVVAISLIFQKSGGRQLLITSTVSGNSEYVDVIPIAPELWGWMSLGTYAADTGSDAYWPYYMYADHV